MQKIDLGLTGYDELFMNDTERKEIKLPRIYDIPLSEIDDFPDHPFKVKLDEDMDQLVQSIKERGIITPVTLRPKEDGRYEIISGHRRKKACELAGFDTVKAEVRELTRDEAIILMVESNLQRSVILPSEKAFSYKMRLEAMNRQGQRSDLTSTPVVSKSRSNEELGSEHGESREQVRRYIRLTELIPELLDLVDEGRIAFRPAVELSYLQKEEQGALLEQIAYADATPSLAQAIKLKRFSQDGKLNNEVIESIRSGNAAAMNKFREKYRTIDVLMIDDVQFIIGKESTQEEFFHTFNALHSAGKQIILTSDKPPKEMETLEERIRSRFEWGLMADIGTPDYETRMAILRKKIEADEMNLSDEILNYIATNIKSNIRELEGALNKLLAYSNLEKTEITMEIAQKELQNIITPDKPKEITPQLIIEVVSEHFQISLDQMISKNRSKDIARPRQIAMYLCKNMTDTPLDSIGALLGGRDHSTIIHGVQKISDEYESDETTRSLIDTIKKKINPN